MPSRSARFASAGVLVVHLAGGIAALVLLPHGFALYDIHMWSNTVVPAMASLAVALALIGLVVVRAFATKAMSALAAAAAGGWTSAIVTGAALFPTSITFARVAVPALVTLVLLAVARWSSVRT